MLKVWLSLGAVALVVFCIWYYGHTQYETGYKEGSDHVIAEDTKKADDQKLKNQEIERGWQKKIDDANKGQTTEHELVVALRNRPPTVVRLCTQPPHSSGTAKTPGPEAGETAGSGVVPEMPGRDIGPDLKRLGFYADVMLEHFRSFQLKCPAPFPPP